MSDEKLNREHYHVWRYASERMNYRLIRSFHTRQAARQWGKRWIEGEGRGRFEVKACWNPKCAPKLD